MCGLAGLFAYASGAPAPSMRELVAIRDHMAARGPDGAGEWTSPDARCLLGHRRLKILDLSDRAAQPMLSEDGKLAIVFNGEIYNYPALRDELLAAGARLRTTSDTEALLHLYARHGAEMTEKLEGMYAFAIWDADKNGLFLARDPYGIKPLYYADDGRTFRFASQVKALLAGGAVSSEMDPAGLAGFCLLGSVPEPFTMHRAISALPAGSSLWVDANGARAPAQFASIGKIIAEAEANTTNVEETVASALRASVRAHLLADVEVGLFLSAGIDSGALLGLMRDAGQERIRAITLGFDEFAGAPYDEVPLAADIARLYGADHTFRRVARDEFVADKTKILAAMDQPSIDGINTWFVAKAAKEAGLKAALSGLGGDELFAGYNSFTSIPRLVRIFSLTGRMPGLGALTRRALSALHPGLNPKALALAELAGAYPGAYLVRRGLFMPHELPRVIGADLAREGLARLEPIAHIEARMTPDPGAPIARVAALESQLYMRNQLLRDADWAGMAHGLEIRTPLVHAPLLRALAPLLPLLAGGRGKHALAHAPKQPLPECIVSRRKTGFGVPMSAWLDPGGSAHPRQASRRWALSVLSTFGVTSPPTL